MYLNTNNTCLKQNFEAGPMASDPPCYRKVGCYEAGPMASDPPRYGKEGCYEAGPMASDPPLRKKKGCYEAGPMASDPPLRERRMKRGWAHDFRSSAKGKKDDRRLGPWLQILR